MIYNEDVNSKQQGGFVEALVGWIVGIGILGFLTGPWLIIVAVPFVLLSGLLLSPLVILSWILLYRAEAPRSLRVLVADDDKISIGPLMHALSHRPVEISFVENGKDVLRALSKQKFDFLFLDLAMPDLAGDRVLTVGERILSGSNKTPVIFYTSHREKAKKMLNKQFNSFVVSDIWEKTMPFAALHRGLDRVFGLA